MCLRLLHWELDRTPTQHQVPAPLPPTSWPPQSQSSYTGVNKTKIINCSLASSHSHSHSPPHAHFIRGATLLCSVSLAVCHLFIVDLFHLFTNSAQPFSDLTDAAVAEAFGAFKWQCGHRNTMRVRLVFGRVWLRDCEVEMVCVCYGRQISIIIIVLIWLVMKWVMTIGKWAELIKQSCMGEQNNKGSLYILLKYWFQIIGEWYRKYGYGYLKKFKCWIKFFMNFVWLWLNKSYPEKNFAPTAKLCKYDRNRYHSFRCNLLNHFSDAFSISSAFCFLMI